MTTRRPPRVVIGCYMVRFPMGGNLSWNLQWLLGCHRLGMEVYAVERAGYEDACFHPGRNEMGDDPSWGTAAVDRLLGRFGLEDRWCYAGYDGRHHGMSRERAESVLRTADVFVDLGLATDWAGEAAPGGVRVLVDGEPAFTQMAMVADPARFPDYDAYFTPGLNLGTPASTAPTAGKRWRPILSPIVLDLFAPRPVPPGAAFTTVMNWRGHEEVEFEGRRYGLKDTEFERFMHLPERTRAPLEVAATVGQEMPEERLRRAGWRLVDPRRALPSVDGYRSYIEGSRGEFSIAKHGFVATNCGWFSERSATYLASGRPVVLQETGFGAHLPCGEGLFAVRTVEEAASALDEIDGDWNRHARRARAIAEEHFDARLVLRRFFAELGL